MDVRNARGLVGGAARHLDAFNRRHPWSHNDHFHKWILRRLPDDRQHALDVGCGRGELVAALSERFARVTGVDADPGMARAAGERFIGDDRVTIRQQSFAEVTGRFDVITMVAVLHHLDTGTALHHAARLLADGGRLLVVGLARPATVRDLAWDLTSAVTNPLVGLAKHPRRATVADPGPPFPTKDPLATFDDVVAVAARTLPGVAMRRRLFFRYTLEWTKPRQESPAAPP